MKIKAFISLDELANKCKCDVADLLHEAALGNLRLSLQFYGKTPDKALLPKSIDSKTPQLPKGHPDAGVFDLHLEDAIALATYGQIEVENIFSPCGNWTVSFSPPRVVTSADVVVRNEEAQSFKIGEELTEPILDTERSRLLRLIAGMAMLIAKNNKKYTHGDKPNAFQIGEAVHDLLKALPDANLYGLGDTNIRTNISKGIDLLKK